MPMAEPSSWAFGSLLAFELDDPGGLAALVGEQAKLRHEARDVAHQLQHAGVAVAPGAQDGVCVDHGGGFRPGEDIALLGDIAHLVQVAGAGVIVVVGDAELAHLLLIALLLGVHDLFEYQIVQQGRRDLGIQGLGVGGELLPLGKARLNELVIEIVYRLHDLQTEGDHRVAVLACDRHHALRAEGFAVHDQGLHDLGHDLAFLAVQQGLLLGGEDHGKPLPSLLIFLF